MAPDILEYLPYIHSIFNSESSQFKLQIADIGLQNKSEIVRGFSFLLELSEGRWDSVELLELFEQPGFQRRHQITSSDFSLIRQWIETSGIRWGETSEHRNELLKRSHCLHDIVEETEIGTWDYGI